MLLQSSTYRHLSQYQTAILCLMCQIWWEIFIILSCMGIQYRISQPTSYQHSCVGTNYFLLSRHHNMWATLGLMQTWTDCLKLWYDILKCRDSEIFLHLVYFSPRLIQPHSGAKRFWNTDRICLLLFSIFFILIKMTNEKDNFTNNFKIKHWRNEVLNVICDFIRWTTSGRRVMSESQSWQRSFTPWRW